MTAQKRDWFIAETTVEHLLEAFSKIYGSVDSMKLEWYSGMASLDRDKYNVQLGGLSRTGISAAGVSYEIELWDFYEREQEEKNYALIEEHIQIAKDVESLTEGILPLTYINARKEDLDERSGLPKAGARIWLMYGSVD